jgi:hypothetical protein
LKVAKVFDKKLAFNIRATGVWNFGQAGRGSDLMRSVKVVDLNYKVIMWRSYGLQGIQLVAAMKKFIEIFDRTASVGGFVDDRDQKPSRFCEPV